MKPEGSIGDVGGADVLARWEEVLHPDGDERSERNLERDGGDVDVVIAARRGVQVDLVIPKRSNHRLADFARHRLLRDLVHAGVYVWLHPEMLHAKAVLVDNELALAGSAKLDNRSLFLNYEMMVAFYDGQAVTDFSQWVEKRRKECSPYVARSPGVVQDLLEGLVLWLGFQL